MSKSLPKNIDQEKLDALAVEFRRQMLVVEDWVYLDHAAVAPISQPAHDAALRYANEALTQGALDWGSWSRRVEKIRDQAANLIGAKREEIALVHNTTTAISLVAEGFPWQPGDNVVTLADEFPSNVYPWMNLERRGVETRLVPTDLGRIDLDQLADTCDERTRMVAISWVGYSTGFRYDLKSIGEIAHRCGALLSVDAIQGLGALSLDVTETPIDFLAADGHKWQLGPEGSAILYIKQEHLDRLDPLIVGWNSVRHDHDFSRLELDLKPSAERYEGGSQNMVGVLAHGASLDLLVELGIENIEALVLRVTDYACQRLTEFGAHVVSHRDDPHLSGSNRSGIVSFELPGRDPAAVRRHCRRHNIQLACRAGRLRISPHGYNNQADIDRLIEVLSMFPKG